MVKSSTNGGFSNAMWLITSVWIIFSQRLPGRNVCRGEERKFAKPRCLVPYGDIVFFTCWSSNLSSHVSTGTETAGNCGDSEPILPAEEITDKDVQIVQSIFDKVHEEETKEVRSGNPTRFFQ